VKAGARKATDLRNTLFYDGGVTSDTVFFAQQTVVIKQAQFIIASYYFFDSCRYFACNCPAFSEFVFIYHVYTGIV